jgi:hypothetical protein
MMRRRADLNRRKRFCRPLPNRSATSPRIVCACSTLYFFVASFCFVKYFAESVMKTQISNILDSPIERKFCLGFSQSTTTSCHTCGGRYPVTAYNLDSCLRGNDIQGILQKPYCFSSQEFFITRITLPHWIW